VFTGLSIGQTKVNSQISRFQSLLAALSIPPFFNLDYHLLILQGFKGQPRKDRLLGDNVELLLRPQGQLLMDALC
jgi:hypothetical protein